MKEQRPFLIRGDDLRDFIRKRRKARKTKTALHQFFCLGCRDVRDAAGGFAECRISGNRVALNAAFNNAGLQPFGPHSFRHMRSRHISRTCKSLAELIAASQNLGHSDPLMTLKHYGQISREEQRRLVTGEEREEGEEGED